VSDWQSWIWLTAFGPRVTDRDAMIGRPYDVEALLDRAKKLDEDSVLRGLSSFVEAVLWTNRYWVDPGRTVTAVPPVQDRSCATSSAQSGDAVPRGLRVLGGRHLWATRSRGGIRWSDPPRGLPRRGLRADEDSAGARTR
jgi:hypothetical protein